MRLRDLAKKYDKLGDLDDQDVYFDREDLLFSRLTRKSIRKMFRFMAHARKAQLMKRWKDEHLNHSKNCSYRKEKHLNTTDLDMSNCNCGRS